MSVLRAKELSRSILWLSTLEFIRCLLEVVMDSLLRKLDKATKTTKHVRLSQEEVGRAILLLSTEDVKRRFLIGNVILRQGLSGLPELILAMRLEKPEIRRTVVYILGRLSGKLIAAEQRVPTELTESIYCGLLDEDPKVRANSAIALGTLRISESVGNLVDALDRETAPWVRPSMILALGSIGSAEVVAYLQSYQPHHPSERAALDKALDRSAGVEWNWRFINKPANAMPLELWTFEGLEHVVAEGVKKELSLPVGEVTRGRVITSSTDPCSFFKLRTFSELLIPLAKVRLHMPCVGDGVKAVVSEMLGQEDILGRILSLHEVGPEVMRYRLEIRGKGLGHHMRRAIIREIAELITATNPMFVSSPSHYDVEIRALLEEETLEFLLKPFTIADTRFSYRTKDVPAAINPVVAAGIVRFAPRLSSHGRILDPFCGSGTVLIERAFAGGYKELVGFDVSRTAIEAAVQNAGAAGLSNVTLINDDMRRVSRKEPFDEIITNMPFGIRSSKHETNVKLYEEFFDLVPHILAKHGLTIVYTQEVRLTTRLFHKSKYLKLLNIHRVTSGGLKPAVFVGMRE